MSSISSLDNIDESLFILISISSLIIGSLQFSLGGMSLYSLSITFFILVILKFLPVVDLVSALVASSTRFSANLFPSAILEVKFKNLVLRDRMICFVPDNGSNKYLSMGCAWQIKHNSNGYIPCFLKLRKSM